MAASSGRHRRLWILCAPIVAAGLTASSLTGMSATPAMAATTPGTQPCTTVVPWDWDMDAAARLAIPGPKGGPPTAVGMAEALSVKAAFEEGLGTNPCDEPVSEDDRWMIDNVQEYIDAGDEEYAAELIKEYVELLDASQSMRANGSRSLPRAGENVVCEWQTATAGIKIPGGAVAALALGRLAYSIGRNSLGDWALQRMQSIVADWARGGADGLAATPMDWLMIDWRLQVLAIEGEDFGGVGNDVKERFRASMKKAYEGLKRSQCRLTKESFECWRRAAVAMEFTAVGDVPQADISYMVKAGRNPGAGKRNGHCDERYAFRMQWRNGGPGVGEVSFDTGRIVLTTKGGRVRGTGTLILGGKGTDCWSRQDGGPWKKGGYVEISGGRFPVRINGQDAGDTLALRMDSAARWKLAPSNADICAYTAGLFQFAADLVLAVLTNYQVPAGRQYVDEQTRTWVFEPTGALGTEYWRVSLELLR